MRNSNINSTSNDIKALIKDAQSLLHDATALSGEKADEMRNSAMHLLDTVVTKAQDAQACTLIASKEMVASADGYVKENTWSMIVIAAGVGFLFGAILSRK
ncbi:MAG: DUF883 family protein [Glaciimonas sp.]|nr:DUF883 family protein [Glaciimonas sp.]